MIPLAVGDNVIAVEVTAEDGQTTKTYAVKVTRAEASLPVTVDLSPSGPMTEGTEIAVTMTFGGLTFDTDRSTIDYTFRADVVDSENGDADGCEDQANGYGLGVDRYMYQVDEDPEARTGTISADCPAGDYTLRASVSSPDNVALVSASTSFTVSNPPKQQQPEPASTDATLSGLTLSGALFAFDPAIESYEVSVGHEVEQTTITAETNDEAASYEVALVLSASYEDGTVGLAVGANLIVLLVTACGWGDDEDLHPQCHQGRSRDAFHGRRVERPDAERCGHRYVRPGYQQVRRRRGPRRGRDDGDPGDE